MLPDCHQSWATAPDGPMLRIPLKTLLDSDKIEHDERDDRFSTLQFSKESLPIVFKNGGPEVESKIRRIQKEYVKDWRNELIIAF